MFFRDTYPLGRIPALIPATWEDGWPTFGDDGVVRVGDTFAKPIVLDAATERRERLKSIVASDDFANDAEHRAFSDTVWEVPDAPTYDESLLGVELVANPGFEDAGTAPWAAQFGATLSRETSGAASGTGALRVAGRTLNGSGPNQQLGGKIQAGVTYEVSARVRYASGPAQVRFNLVGDWGAGVTTLAWANATPGSGRPCGAPTPSRRTPTSGPSSSRSRRRGATRSRRRRASSTCSTTSPWSAARRTSRRPRFEEVSYNGSDLDLAWQWNHAPDNRYWSSPSARAGCA